MPNLDTDSQYHTPQPTAVWDYTERLDDVVARRQLIERQRGATERPTITRDSRIDGGVYEGRYGGEAIVVDSDKYPDGFREAMRRILPHIQRSDGTIDKRVVLSSVFDVVSDMLPYDAEGVDAVFNDPHLGAGKDGTKITLDTYIVLGVGVCRHQALFVGQLLEALADGAIINGRVSVDRNKDRLDVADPYDGHAWARYTNSAGRVYILDVAQRVLAPLDELMERRAKGENVWDYGRPEDHYVLRGQGALRHLGGGDTGNQRRAR